MDMWNKMCPTAPWVSSTSEQSYGSASLWIHHHRPAFNIVRPVERSVDLLC